MKKVSLITFKGCKSTIDFFNQLETRIDEEDLNVEVEMILVPSPEKSVAMGLFGSPTILINGVELQRERRGPAGFYWRAYTTAEGFRPYPRLDDIVAILQDRASAPAVTAVASLASLPTLVTANWCPFTVTAANFWQEVTQAVGLTLSVVDIQSQTGEQVVSAANVSGVPCLVAAPEQKMYGIHVSPAEAKAFLQAAIADNRADWEAVSKILLPLEQWEKEVCS